MRVAGTADRWIISDTLRKFSVEPSIREEKSLDADNLAAIVFSVAFLDIVRAATDPRSILSSPHGFDSDNK